ncbi:MAG: cysteine hydrolase family protein [Pseudonocardiaceae bacterium]
MTRTAIIIGDLQVGITRNYSFAEELVPRDPGLDFQDSDVLITKRRASAFHGTDLNIVLSSNGVDTLVVAGVATSAMAATTVYDALDRDFSLRVVKDVGADPVEGVHEFFVDTVFPGRASRS